MIGAVRSDDDIAALRKDGADDVINSRANVVEAVQSLTGNRGAQVVFDASGMMFAEAIEAAAPDGRVPIVAAPPDGKVSFNLRTLYRKMLRVHGIDTLRLDAIACAKLLAQMTPWFEAGQFKAKVGKPMPLSAVAEAYELAGHGGGRIFLEPTQ